jgi:hypothetical protein
MTVRDLTEKYNQFNFDKIEILDLTPKQKAARKKDQRRVEKTIYKYLNFLQKEGLIVKAGKRIQVDEAGRITQAASENLFGRTARVYIYSGEDIKWDEEEDFMKVVSILGKMLSLTSSLPEPSVECLSEILIDIFSRLSKDRKETIQKYSNQLADLSRDITYDTLIKAIRSFDFLNTILIAPEYQEELKKCFRS